MLHSVTVDLGHGREITIESGKLAKQANGAVVVRSGESVVLVTACSNQKPKPNAAFFPLTVDYREATYSAGRFPGGFIKREGRPTEKEVLTCRLIDRPIRPLFPEGFMCETQVICMVLSADPTKDPAPLAMIGAAASLAISEIPFHHLLAACRVGLVNGEMIPNPTYAEEKAGDFSIIVAGTATGVVMVEAGGKGVMEDKVVDCIDYGLDCCGKIIAGIQELVKKCGKPKRSYTPPVHNADMAAQIEKLVRKDLTDALDTKKYSKLDSYSRVDALHEQAAEAVAAGIADEKLKKAAESEAGELFDRLKEKIFRDEMLLSKHRPDGRKFDEIRNIEVEANLLPRTHGSALFTRGETQALVTTTLGTSDDAQRIELLDPDGLKEKRFMLFYNFPPFSVNEVGFMRGPGRREIGHGALAERAILPVLPDDKKFPYTMKVVSEILESNGSSSMASVCGGILSLMDAGVPISAPVAGIAMGLVVEGDKYAILTDIAGAEDHYGDMDFKVAGTKDGITALQMDLKMPNVSTKIMREALEQARQARLFILGKMTALLAEPRPDLSPNAPRIHTLQIPVDNGTAKIFSTTGTAAQAAIQRITDICAVAEIGKIYLGKVVRIVTLALWSECRRSLRTRTWAITL